VAEIWLTSLDGTQRLPLYSIGPYGAWGDLTYQFRWGDGACGMYEAQWTMPLPPQFEHPLLRRGSLVEIQQGPWRMGSPLVLSEPAKGTGYDDPWQLVATGIGRDVEGDNSFYAFRLSDGGDHRDPVRGRRLRQPRLRVARRGPRTSVPTTAVGGNATTEELMTSARCSTRRRIASGNGGVSARTTTCSSPPTRPRRPIRWSPVLRRSGPLTTTTRRWSGSVHRLVHRHLQDGQRHQHPGRHPVRPQGVRGEPDRRWAPSPRPRRRGSPTGSSPSPRVGWRGPTA
jgi:hypothetical protein